MCWAGGTRPCQVRRVDQAASFDWPVLQEGSSRGSITGRGHYLGGRSRPLSTEKMSSFDGRHCLGSDTSSLELFVKWFWWFLCAGLGLHSCGLEMLPPSECRRRIIEKHTTGQAHLLRVVTEKGCSRKLVHCTAHGCSIVDEPPVVDNAGDTAGAAAFCRRWRSTAIPSILVHWLSTLRTSVRYDADMHLQTATEHGSLRQQPASHGMHPNSPMDDDMVRRPSFVMS